MRRENIRNVGEERTVEEKEEESNIKDIDRKSN